VQTGARSLSARAPSPHPPRASFFNSALPLLSRNFVFHKGRERGQQEQDTSVLDVQSAAGNEEINSSISALRDISLEKNKVLLSV
jgi:hypothetical protein